MRVTIGKIKRAYLYDCRLGSRRVIKKMKNGVQIWPTHRDLVRYAVLDLAPITNTVEGAYWQHALAAVRSGSWEGCRIRVTAGGRAYNLLTTYGRYDVAGYEHATLDFGDHGPLMTSLKSGDRVSVSLVIPEKEWTHVWYNENRAESSFGVPFIPGSSVRLCVVKGQKKRSAGVRFELKGAASGSTHIAGYAQKNGHGRGTFWGTAYAASGAILNGWVEGFHNAVIPGDASMSLAMTGYNGGSGEGFIVTPGFSLSLKLKVLSTVRHG